MKVARANLNYTYSKILKVKCHCKYISLLITTVIISGRLRWYGYAMRK